MMSQYWGRENNWRGERMREGWRRRGREKEGDGESKRVSCVAR